jgi:hypothetical protein
MLIFVLSLIKMDLDEPIRKKLNLVILNQNQTESNQPQIVPALLIGTTCTHKRKENNVNGST